MTEIYIDKADLNMYQLKTAPPKWDLQEYIVTYLKEKDNRYLAWFLHYYEKTLNNNVQEYMRKLFMPEHFADMKQAYIAGLLKALKNYDIKQGASFTSFKERYVEREILDYVRSMRTGFTAQSIAEYAKFRKAMAIWYKYERDYSDETLIKVAGELEETVENTKKYYSAVCSMKTGWICIGNTQTMTVKNAQRRHIPTVPLTLIRCL